METSASRKTVGYFIAFVAASLLLLIGVLRILFPYIDQYKGSLEKIASSALHQPVEIGHMSANWTGIFPVLHFNNISVYDSTKSEELLKIQHLKLSINLFSSLLHWQLKPDRVDLNGAHLSIQTLPDGSVALNGIKLNLGEKNNNQNAIESTLQWLNQQGQIGINNVDVLWKNAEDTQVKITDLKMLLTSGMTRRNLTAQGLIACPERPSVNSLPCKETTPFKIVVKFKEALNGNIHAQGYISTNNFNLPPWLKDHLPNHLQLTQGYLRHLEIWADWQKSQLQQAQALFSISNVLLLNPNAHNPYRINTFDGELNWALDSENSPLKKVSINARNINIEMADFFTQPLVLDQLKLNAAWQSNPNLKLILENFFLENSEIQLRGKLQLDRYADTSYLQLLTGFSANNVGKLHKYIPKGVLSPKFNTWLSAALVKGDNIRGEVLIHGPLNHFPFADHTGRFEALLQTKNLDFHYLPNWPDLNDMQANLLFDNERISVDVIQAKMLNAPVKNLHATVSDWDNPILTLRWNTNTKYSDLASFIFESPLNNALGNTFKNINYVGPTYLKLAMTVPLGDPKKLKVQGSMEFMPMGILTLPNYKITLNNFHGNLQFTEDSVQAKTLQGNWLNQPTLINISTEKKIFGPEININVMGALSFPELIRQYNLNYLSDYFNGITKYTAKLIFSKTAQAYQTQIAVNSDLAGAGINFPPPFKKAPQEIKPTSIKLNLLPAELTASINYGKAFSAIVAMKKNNVDKWRVDRGDIEFGNANAKLPTMTGVIIGGHMQNLNVVEIANHLPRSTNKASNTNSSQSFSLADINLNNANLNIDQLIVPGMTLHRVAIKVKKADHSWLANLNSTEIAGNLLIPTQWPNKTIRAYFPKFNISPITTHALKNGIAEKIHKNKQGINPDQIPPLYILFQNLNYDGHALGTVCLITAREKNTMLIDQFSVNFPFFSFVAVGRWQSTPTGHNTVLGGNMQTTNLGTILNNWELTSTLRDGKGWAKFLINWRGPVYQPDPATLNGKFSFSLEDGKILNVIKNGAEAGIGHILNLLSVQSLQTLLSKPFSLLTPSNDFAFKTLKGDFVITNGNAATKNTVLEGNLAKVEAKGQIGLATQDYNLELKVTPYLTGSVPGASAFAAGPFIGAGLWIANKLIGGILNHFFSTTYHVSGPWAKPSFQKI